MLAGLLLRCHFLVDGFFRGNRLDLDLGLGFGFGRFADFEADHAFRSRFRRFHAFGQYAAQPCPRCGTPLAFILGGDMAVIRINTCDAAVVQGHEQVVPVRDQLLATLTKLGLSKVAQAEVAFDPNVHEAVLHDEGGADDGPVVVEVLRTGYLWHQRTLRAAMVRVRG